jgi:hypothetical protein
MSPVVVVHKVDYVLSFHIQTSKSPAAIETINDQLKNISQIEHSRHRSPRHFLINLLSGLIAYQFKEKKPSISLKLDDAQLSMAV